MHDIIIVGAGPAGLTAALYAKRSGRSVLLLEGETFGGQIATSPRVENYPALPQVSGLDLTDALVSQVTALETDIDVAKVTALEKTQDGFLVRTEYESYAGRAVILASGVQHRTLGLPEERGFFGKGISFCAVCDGALFKNREVAIVGGGNAALQEAIYLSAICSRVHLIHRRDSFRAEQELVLQVEQAQNITLHRNSTIIALAGEQRLESLTLRNGQGGEETSVAVSALFESIGKIPANEPFASLVSLEGGYIAAGEDCKTSCAGVFAAGDCRTKQIRQLTTAVSDGTIAALGANDYLK
ncbi:MAG: FAD-dependent oxidoreductase [Oscillospiraceae bacterium]|jgi:thioredoxin reductase (NADPH)|nr:FAD-dependent oxidoreductase [Oscillospiraceae bacterium]